MSVDATWLFVSLIPGGIGFVLLFYAKKYGSIPHFVAGLAFVVYPYFTESLIALIVVGIAIGVAFWLALRAGW
ncbi:MAG TPA: hypothetical protein VGY57_13285 [Vicinamibacterales bacterium]|nr:hypothetical protein [Vicinamibacterales bacterium]